MEAVVMRRYLAVAAALMAFAAVLSGCRQYKPPIGYTAPIGTLTPAPQGISSYPPDKTASQDTAGAVTKLPEEATAAVTMPNGTLAP
jgi:hypothetical protein